MSHPGVLETSVIGVPDDQWGERPRAYVVVKRGVEVDEQDLVAHVKPIEVSPVRPRPSPDAVQRR